MFIMFNKINMVSFTCERGGNNSIYFLQCLHLALLNWVELNWSNPQCHCPSWTHLHSAHSKMTSPVTKAMVESYALMVLVMGTFFVYFCGMVWAFCNPKLSGADEDCASGNQVAEHGDESWVCAPDPPQQDFRCSCENPPPAPPCAHAGHTLTTYVNFWDDTDSLLSDGIMFCREDHGINNQIGHSPSWTI